MHLLRVRINILHNITAAALGTLQPFAYPHQHAFMDTGRAPAVVLCVYKCSWRDHVFPSCLLNGSHVKESFRLVHVGYCRAHTYTMLRNHAARYERPCATKSSLMLTLVM